jgi:hypothetical protein
VTAPIICWYRDRGILVSVDAMRPVQQIRREILTALDGMRPLLDSEAAQARHPGDLATLAEAFGVTGPASLRVSCGSPAVRSECLVLRATRYWPSDHTCSHSSGFHGGVRRAARKVLQYRRVSTACSLVSGRADIRSASLSPPCSSSSCQLRKALSFTEFATACMD